MKVYSGKYFLEKKKEAGTLSGKIKGTAHEIRLPCKGRCHEVTEG